MDLLLLLDKGIELGYAFQGQLIHQVDGVRLVEVCSLEMRTV